MHSFPPGSSLGWRWDLVSTALPPLKASFLPPSSSPPSEANQASGMTLGMAAAQWTQDCHLPTCLPIPLPALGLVSQDRKLGVAALVQIPTPPGSQCPVSKKTVESPNRGL